MKEQIDVCVLGNAVVDGFARVPEEMLARFDLLKGDVSHFSHEDFMKLNEEVILEHFSAGGSGANMASVLAQLGLHVGHLGRVGKDPAGEHFYTELKRLGVHLPDPDDSVRTFQIFILLTPDGERTFVEPETSALITTDWLDKHCLGHSRWLVVEGYVLLDQVDAALSAIRQARRSGAKIALLLPPSAIIAKASEAFSEVIHSGVDLVFSDEVEAACLADALLPNVRKAWAETPRVETRGPSGAAFFPPHQPHVFLPCPAEVAPIDVTGAGEAFAAGFLFGVLHGESPRVCLGYGHQLAAQVIQQLGARLHGLKRELLVKVKEEDNG